LSPTAWPQDENLRALFGDEHVLNLAKLCHINSKAALDDFRLYKNNTRRVGKALQLLIQRVTVLPVSSAECERGFSCMNMNDTAVRNRLAIESLSALIFIKTNGTHPSKFNPVSYVEHWLKENRHSATDAATGKHSIKLNENKSSFASLF